MKFYLKRKNELKLKILFLQRPKIHGQGYELTLLTFKEIK